MSEKKSKGKVLVVDDEVSIRQFLKIMLRREDYDVTTVDSAAGCLEELGQKSFDMVLTDINMPDKDGLELLREIKQQDATAIVVVMTAYGSAESAVVAMKRGAADYITKPFQIEELLLVLKKCMRTSHLEGENKLLRERVLKEFSFEEIIGTSERMQNIFRMIKRVADTTTNVLITGESGTGKELVANAIHNYSKIKDKAFVSVNCGAIPENLMESEMFGHKKGAFTGADSDKKGLFAVADGGTLFLDEVGELQMGLQVKLLRAIQSQTFRMVGGTEDIHVHVRFVCATNKDMEEAVAKKEFREDLYYRLNVIQIQMPSLRQRVDDIPLLAKHFCKRISKMQGRSEMKINRAAMDALVHYNYPGNVRELENMIERAVALSTGDIIELEIFPPRVRERSAPHVSDSQSIDENKIDDVGKVATNSGESEKEIRSTKEPTSDFSGDLPKGFDLESQLEEYERRYILQALDASRGVKSRAAKILGISFRSMRYRIVKFGIEDLDPTEENED